MIGNFKNLGGTVNANGHELCFPADAHVSRSDGKWYVNGVEVHDISYYYKENVEKREAAAKDNEE